MKLARWCGGERVRLNDDAADLKVLHQVAIATVNYDGIASCKYRAENEHISEALAEQSSDFHFTPAGHAALHRTCLANSVSANSSSLSPA